MQLISQTMENEAQIYLRDTLHLGYMTYTQFLSEESIEGQIIVIVGNKYPHENDKNIELYLKKVQNIIGNFTEDNFQKLKDQYLNSIKPNNQNLEMLTIKYWNEISHDTYDFERNKDIIEIMDELTLQDLIEFYSSFIQKQAKISIQIYSKNTSYKILNETIQQSANHTQTETQLVHDLNKIDIQNRYPSQRIDIQNINNQNKIFEKFIGS